MKGQSMLPLVLFVAQSSAIAGAAPPADDGAPTDWVVTSDTMAYRELPTAAGTPVAPRFERIPGKTSGLDFRNELTFENFYQHHYLANGAGVTVGDYDGDGRPDIFLAGQESNSRLYRQVRPWAFEDVTAAAGLPTSDGWASGTAFADMDNDGDLDLFVCYRGSPNRYYINLGNGTFRGTEFAYEPNDRSAPTTIAVMDADLDGDLDAYLLGNRLRRWQDRFDFHLQVTTDAQGRLRPAPAYERDVTFMLGQHLVELGTPDRLLINAGTPADEPLRFDVASGEAGLAQDWALGLATTWFDADNDGDPDLYVSNDFEGADHFYLNEKGRFQEVTREALASTSLYSMGADYADLNNDGWIDLITADMSNTTHFKSKVMMGDMNSLGWLLDWAEPRQAMRNFVHINTGTGAFLESAFFSHLSSTDWTWSVLCGDLDLDGRVDVYFTNGLFRNLQDADFDDTIKRMQADRTTREEIAAFFRAQSVYREKNLCFRNQGDLHFAECGDAWGLGDEGISHGAVMADLDRDGDLDIVVNNQNEEAALYRNQTGGGGRLLVSLRGKESNTFGLGARLEVEAGGLKQTRYLSSSRGYGSGAEPVVHFGLGDAERVDRLTIHWPGGPSQTFQDLPVNRHYRITEDRSHAGTWVVEANPPPRFRGVPAAALGLDFEHHEDKFNDFAIQPLLPNQISRMGPALAAGDVNGDGLTDLYLGGAHGQPGALFLQSADNRFQRAVVPLLDEDAAFEDTGAVLFDADGDGDADLYVASGGNHATDPAAFRHRLYLNQGNGVWERGVLPDVSLSGQAVAACDFDKDGDQDLFVGGRIVPQRYPDDPGSVLLVNEAGSFRVEQPAGLAASGMVTDAHWTDVDGNGWPDLLVTVEWGSLRLWLNDQGHLEEATADSGLGAALGWWMSLDTGDIDQDGDPDIVAGNWGLNTKYQASSEHPVRLYTGDFGDGRIHLVESCTKQGKVVPVRGLSCSSEAMPFIRDRFPTYRAFASATLEELYTPAGLAAARTLSVDTLATSVFLNDGSGRFTRRDAPDLAQLAPVMGVNLGDVDGDGIPDCLLGQNFFLPQRETGRANGGLCLWMKGRGDGSFEAIQPSRSGIHLRTDVRRTAILDLNRDGLPEWLVVPNDDSPNLFLNVLPPSTVGARRAFRSQGPVQSAGE